MKVMKLFLITSGILLLCTPMTLAYPPAGPVAGPNAQVPQGGPTDSAPPDPEQEGTTEVNRILRDLHLIKEFFKLTDQQMDLIRPEIEATYPDLLAFYQEFHMLRQELRELMNGANPPPGQVGQLIVDIRAVEIQIAEIRGSWGTVIEGILDEDQRNRLERVRRVARILPAFRGVGLIPPPPAQPNQ